MWRTIDWDKMEDQLLRTQQRLARAAYSRDFEAVIALQKQIVRSLPPRSWRCAMWCRSTPRQV